MGKHDKTNFTWEKPEIKVIRYDPPNDEYYKARISTLEKENQELNREVEALEKNEQMLQGCIGEYKDEIDALKMKVKMLEDAIVKAALREVIA